MITEQILNIIGLTIGQPFKIQGHKGIYYYDSDLKLHHECISRSTVRGNEYDEILIGKTHIIIDGVEKYSK